MNVFVNLPDANRRTSVDDPHFAGLVALLEPSGIATRRPSVALDLSSMSVINPDRPLQVTLVPFAGAAEMAPHRAVMIASIHFRQD
jgi:hypothetical protein